MQAVILKGIGGFYYAMDEDGRVHQVRAQRKIRRERLKPKVGDRVEISPGEGEEDGWLEEILPRQSQCLRPPVANVTLLCVVAAPSPAPDWLLVDKLLIFARKQAVTPLLIVNKGDLPGAGETLSEARAMYAGAEMEVLPVCAREEQGLDAIRQRLSGQVCCFSGQSGVGKSTLLNALFGLNQETGEISRKIQRGKNTTRHAQLFIFGPVQVIDTPGFSLLEMDEVFDPVLLRDYYPEFSPYAGQCRFSPCYHGSEPGCAVLKAAKEGKIDSRRLERYHTLLADYRQAWRGRYD